MASLPTLTAGQEFVAMVDVKYTHRGVTANTDVSSALSITATIESSVGASQLFVPVAQSASDSSAIAGSASWSLGQVLVRIPALSTANLSAQLGVLTLQIDGFEYKTGGSIKVIV